MIWLEKGSIFKDPQMEGTQKLSEIFPAILWQIQFHDDAHDSLTQNKHVEEVDPNQHFEML